MKNIRLDLQYKGELFHGSQIQPNVATVQEELEKALNIITKEPVKTIFSGRTDAGVHAHKQVVNFKTNSLIPPDKIKYPINKIINKGILVSNSFEVPNDFNSRFSATYRQYRYFIRKEVDLFKSNYCLFYNKEMNLELLNSIALKLMGKHDFKSFCSTKAEVNNYICNIFHIGFKKQNDNIIFEVVGNRFLHNMIRILISVFIEINNGKLSWSDIKVILDKKDRIFAPKTFPPKGLFLWDIGYGDDIPKIIT